MLTSLLAVAAVVMQPPPVLRTVPQAPYAMTADRIARPNLQSLVGTENIVIRVSSPEGMLWEGTLRVGPNQGASYQQNFSQAPAQLCPPGSYYDRSERRHLNFSINAQHNQQTGPSYRIEASWARPVESQACGESGTRTVQISQTVQIVPGEPTVIEGDAGLRVRLVRAR
jgi:hypothetical protein